MLAHASAPRTLSPPSTLLHGRRPQPPTVALPPLDLHAWADGWSLASSALGGSGAIAAQDDAVSPTSLAPPSAAASRFFGTGAAGSATPSAGSSGTTMPASQVSGSTFTKRSTGLGSSKLDVAAHHSVSSLRQPDGHDEVYHRLRQNSLELSLGDLPKPSWFVRAASGDDQPYPSPVSPASRLFSEQAPSCYFDPSNHRRASAAGSPSSAIGRDDLALPPSPALVPVALEFSGPELVPLPSAPRVEPSLAHPLHRAKRLSMTPLAATKVLPPAADDDDHMDVDVPATPPKVRKSSIVDLPLPPTQGGNGLPFSPPLTPPSALVALCSVHTTKRHRPL